MAHASTLEAQRIFYERHKKDILSLNYRFAVVGSNWYKGYDNKAEIYKDFPALNPDASVTFGGTPPALIDIGELTNSLEYRIEKNEGEMKTCDYILETYNQKKDKLKKEAKDLRKEEKRLK
jgi:hypothetical protein